MPSSLESLASPTGVWLSLNGILDRCRLMVCPPRTLGAGSLARIGGSLLAYGTYIQYEDGRCLS